MDTNRLEAFSDGVFAIAVTLLVLNMHVPENAGTDLYGALGAQWPSYVTYVVSFLTIGIIWVNHHDALAHIHHVDRGFLFLNLLLLMVVSVLPFPTALLADYITQPAAAQAGAVYGATFLGMSIAFSAIWIYASREDGLLGEHLAPAEARSSGMGFFAGLVAYALGIGLAYVSALLSLAVYAAVALYYVYPRLPAPPGHHRQRSAASDAPHASAEHSRRHQAERVSPRGPLQLG